MIQVLAEMDLDVRQCPGIHIDGPGGIHRDLPVQDDGHVQLVVPQDLQHIFDLFVGFLDVQTPICA